MASTTDFTQSSPGKRSRGSSRQLGILLDGLRPERDLRGQALHRPRRHGRGL
ncbi:hypothetical protein ACRAWD_15955 [Caulobacter segnis]